MLKRIKYISRVSQALTPEGVHVLGQNAARRNQELGVTGVLLTGGGIFFQVLEGPPEAIDQLWRAIETDTRHEDVLLLAVQENVPSRIFPDWAMRHVDLDHQANAHMETLRSMLAVAHALRRESDELFRILEQSVWSEFSARAR
jgi:hypothetical protein